MIRNIGVLPISMYQIFLSPLLKSFLGVSAMCRFDETCSAYTKRMILEKGVITGIAKGGIRLLKCQPFSS